MSTIATRRHHLPTRLALLLLAVAAFFLLFAVAFDQGQLAQIAQAGAGGSGMHEAFHDARHVLGFPCH